MTAAAPLNPDEQSQEAVAGRLGKSLRWLQQMLSDDRRRTPSEQRFQFHHHIGRSRRWDENEYQALRAAIIAWERKRRDPLGSSSSTRTVTGTYKGPCGPADVRSALEELLAFQPQPRTTKRVKPTD
jgi:hypothetical protein